MKLNRNWMCLVALTTAVLCRSAEAQLGGTGSTSGLGTSMSGLSGTGTTGFGTTGTSATGSSSTGTGSTGTSRTSGTGSTGTQSGTTGGSNTLGSNATQSFIGGNQTQGFVGGARQSTQQQGMNRQFQAIQNQGTTSSSQTSTGTPRQVRSALRVGFAAPSVASIQAAGRLAAANELSLSRFVGNRPELAGITVAVSSQGVAVLTGATATTESKRLAANLIRLQPGVRSVDNQLSVEN